MHRDLKSENILIGGDWSAFSLILVFHPQRPLFFSRALAHLVYDETSEPSDDSILPLTFGFLCILFGMVTDGH